MREVSIYFDAQKLDLFGDEAITLVKKGSEEVIKQKFTQLYLEKFNIDLKIYDVKVSNGTSLYKN